MLESLGNAHPHQCRRRLVKWHGEISRHGNNSKLLTSDVDTAINEEHDGRLRKSKLQMGSKRAVLELKHDFRIRSILSGNDPHNGLVMFDFTDGKVDLPNVKRMNRFQCSNIAQNSSYLM